MNSARFMLLGALIIAVAPIVHASEPVAPVEQGSTADDPQEPQDDILMIIDLPIVVADAVDAGVQEDDLSDAVAAAREAGIGAGEAALVIGEEVKATRGARGKRRGFSTYVRRELAAGVHGQELAKKIHARGQADDKFSPEERERQAKTLAELKAHNEKHREAVAEKREAWRKSGKPLGLAGRELHDTCRHELIDRREALLASKAALLELSATRENLRQAQEDLTRGHEEGNGVANPDKKAEYEAKKAEYEAKKAEYEAKKAAHEAKQDETEAKQAERGAAVEAKNAEQAAAVEAKKLEIEAKKAERAAAVEAKKLEIEAKKTERAAAVEAKKAEIEAKKAEQAAAVEAKKAEHTAKPDEHAHGNSDKAKKPEQAKKPERDKKETNE